MRQERRESPRTPSNAPLDLYDAKGRMIIGEGHFINVSERGAMVQSQKPLQPKKKIQLHVASARESPLQIQGRVVWTRKQRSGFTYGIRFDSDPSLLTHRASAARA